MKIRQLFFILLMIICTAFTSQSKKPKFYFIVGTDTTFCKTLEYEITGQGFLKKLDFTDMKGKRTTIEGRDNVPDVETFYMDGATLDKVPLKADKPEKFYRYTDRVVDGKLRVYLAEQKYYKNDPVGINRFYLKMPNGTYYKINDKSNMKEHIKPYLLKCAEFKKTYKGDYSDKEQPFMDMIKLYNFLCGEE